MYLKSNHGWTIGAKLGAYVFAVLFYRPERRLSISVGVPGWSRNIRLCGPKKLSFER